MPWESETVKNGEESPLGAIPLDVRKLRKTFQQGSRSIEAVGNVDLKVEKGKFIAIMGPSGSGKSTLLHLIAGLTKPDAGSIEIEGRDITGLSDFRMTELRRRRIGIVFQAYNLIPTLTAEQNITLPLALDRNGAKQKRDLSTLLTKLNLAERRHHLPDALSGGEQQRVAIARALATNPAILLADEPTGNLDTGTTQAICRLLKGFCRREGRTVLLVTHEPSVAMHADTLFVMKDGRLGPPISVDDPTDSTELARRYQALVSSPSPGTPAS